MSSSDMRIRDAITQQAAEWFVANQAEPLSEHERAAFVTWLRASPLHVEEYLELATVARSLADAAADPAVDIDQLIAEAGDGSADNVVPISRSAFAVRPLPRRRWYRHTSALAASMLLTVVAASVITTGWIHRGDWLGVATTYASGHGERATFALPDGSAMQLNAESSVTVRYDIGERHVDLERGQALLTVAHGSHRPFRVAAGGVRVVAVGTRFDVSKWADAATITVIEGQVVVSAPLPSAGAGERPAVRSVAVVAGERVRIDASGVPAAPSPADLNSADAWLRGQIAFQSTPLGEVADEFNAYAPVHFEIHDRSLRRELISGNFSADDYESFALFLASIKGVVIERAPGQIVVSRDAGSTPEPQPASTRARR
jgi:transmembrane sensor